MIRGRIQIFRQNRSRGFTFVEVLFAVILLGIGFIMIAGIFPVAIQQSAVTADENAGMAVARGAIEQIQMAINAGMPCRPTLGFQPFLYGRIGTTPNINQMGFLGSASLYSDTAQNTPVWSNSINTADRRYSWVAFYNRGIIISGFNGQGQPFGSPAPYAQVIVVALKNVNFPNYIAPPPIPNSSGVLNTYGTRMFSAFWPAQISQDGSGNALISLDAPNVVTGAFAIVAQSPNTNGASPDLYPTAGRIYRLGAQVATAGGFTQTFQIQPGSDPQNNEIGAPGNVNVYIVGRAPTAGGAVGGGPTDFSGAFTGPNQDIAAVSAIVRINQ